MTRRYPIGYSVSVHITNYKHGPWCRVVLIEEGGAAPQKLQGYIGTDAMEDVAAMVFALLEEARSAPDPHEPF